MKGREPPKLPRPPPRLPCLPRKELALPPPAGTRDILIERGPAGFAQWMKEQKRVLLTDTTMRDAHQSLFATRMRTADMTPLAPYYARLAPDLLQIGRETWRERGGTDV